MAHNLELGDLVLCTVDRIIGTVVFVKIECYTSLEGGIVTSEIAPGRIRNLRDYVVPKKKIVCKVLRLENDRIDLSLRRVTPKEQKYVFEKYKQEQSYKSVLKGILGEKAERIMEAIEREETVYDFLDSSKDNAKKLEKLVGIDNAAKIINILKTEKIKSHIVKKTLNLKTTDPEGVNLIKELFSKTQNIDVNYIAAGRYSLIAKAQDPKKAENILRENLHEMEKTAKKLGLEFSIKEK